MNTKRLVVRQNQDPKFPGSSVYLQVLQGEGRATSVTEFLVEAFHVRLMDQHKQHAAAIDARRADAVAYAAKLAELLEVEFDAEAV